jgi:anti-anti-sigma factor
MSTPAATSLSITQNEHDQPPVLALAGELDATTAPQLATVALGIVEDGARDLILDAAGLTFCDSSGLSVFVQVAERLRVRAGRLAIVTPSESLLRSLESGLLGEAIVVAGSVAGALYAIHRDHP